MRSSWSGLLEAAAHPEPVASGVPSPPLLSGLWVFSFLFFSSDDLTAAHFLPSMVASSPMVLEVRCVGG